MPPKKKQEEIDLSTLPECKILNIFLYCKGKKQRCEAILGKINSKYQSFIHHVQKSAVLDHAKQKGIYVDPESLTDKQKKDPKFMETVCTEMTPAVLAKATDSYVSNQSIKFRVEMKGNMEKPEQQQTKNTKKFDCLYIFDDFPTETSDFEALAQAGQSVKYAVVIDPKISWASAPEMPEEEEGEGDQDGDPEPEDEEIVEYKRLMEAEKFNEQDEKFEKGINDMVENLRGQRRKASKSSTFRNMVIHQISAIVDPYAEENSLEEITKQFITEIDNLIGEAKQFEEWLKDKKCQDIAPQQKQEQSIEGEPKEDEEKKLETIVEEPSSKIKVKTNSTLQILMEMVENIAKEDNKEKNSEDEVDLEGFDFNAPVELEKKADANESVVNNPRRSKHQKFYGFNQKKNAVEKNIAEEIISKMKFPGVDRFMIPEVPSKSEGVRKNYRASFGQFLPENLSFHEFERKTDLLSLEETARENDEDRVYNFSDRIFEEQHNRSSLMRELNKALLFDESTICTKYNENNDKLYLALLYKNPARRMSKKFWQSNWKVLPNFQNWLHHFKDNETNLNNAEYFNIDYEKIGNIQEQANIYTIKDGGAIIRKKSRIAGNELNLLYCMPGEGTDGLIFGVRRKGEVSEFFAENESVKILQSEVSVEKKVEKKDKEVVEQNQENKEEAEKKEEVEAVIQTEKYHSTFFTFQDKTIIEVKNNTGDVILRKPDCPVRLITPSGYTIIYENQPTVLHPNGGISHPPNQYINEYGNGLKDQKLLQTIPTLKRRTQNGNELIKRHDNTIIVKQSHSDKKWIKFPDQTEYLCCEGKKEIVIEKALYPSVKCQVDGGILVTYNGVVIDCGKGREGACSVGVKFQRVSAVNNSSLEICQSRIEVRDGKTQNPYICDISDKCPSILKSWEGEGLKVWHEKSEYRRGEKILNPLEDEENYTEADTLQPDYLPPRLFIINNNNTGKELLSEKQIKQGYLQAFLNEKNSNNQGCEQFLSATIDGSSRPVQHGVIPVRSEFQLNKKKIKKCEVCLDVFKTQEMPAQPIHPNQAWMQLRSLIRNNPVTEEERQTIEEIRRRRNEAVGKMEKDDNQFGQKPRKDPSTAERFDMKRVNIQFRKIEEEPICFDEMKKELISTYHRERERRNTNFENMRKEEEMRKKMSRKRSYISQYIWKQPAPRPYDENREYYTSTDSFYSNYFKTIEGQKALKGMPDWVFKPKEKKKQKQLDPQIRSELLNRTRKEEELSNTMNNMMNNTNNNNNNNHNHNHNHNHNNRSMNEDDERNERNERYDTVEVDIKPTSQIYIKPSVFTQREIDEERFAFESEKKAYEYHEMKRKEYDPYGRERKQKIEVPSLMRTQPVSELNQKYLVTEAPVDKKIKISSMKNKLTSQAANMTEMRKEGPHTNLIRTLDKRNDYSKLLQKRTMMVQADLNDKLQRDIQINPIQANFGTVKESCSYELKIEIKNEDILSQRIILKKPKSIFSKVSMNEMGPLALGMTRKITVQIKASPEMLGRFTDEFDIVTKHEIYHIPIVAQIVSKNQFESGKCLLARGVRQFEELKLKKKEGLPPIVKNEEK